MYSLPELLADHQIFHSSFQQDNFITKMGGGGTLYGQYKQALREVATRVDSLVSLYYRHDKLLIDLDELENKINTSKKKWFKRPTKSRIAKWKLQLKQKIMLLHNLVATIEATETEFQRFYSQAAYLKSKLFNKYGALTKDLKDKLEQELWVHKAKEAVAINLVTNGRLLNTTYEMIVALPPNARQQVLSAIKNTDIVAWYEQLDNNYFGEDFKVIPIHEIKQTLLSCYPTNNHTPITYVTAD